MRHVSPFGYEKNGPDGDWHRTNMAQLKDGDIWSEVSAEKVSDDVIRLTGLMTSLGKSWKRAPVSLHVLLSSCLIRVVKRGRASWDSKHTFMTPSDFLHEGERRLLQASE